jgi:hypothetical protein
LPFTSLMLVTLTNNYPDFSRRISGSIDLELGSGAQYSNWRAGFTNVLPGDSYIATWNQNFPSLGSLVGDNTFSLTAQDVTPSPWNQPPYPPAGDTATAGCTVTGTN